MPLLRRKQQHFFSLDPNFSNFPVSVSGLALICKSLSPTARLCCWKRWTKDLPGFPAQWDSGWSHRRLGLLLTPHLHLPPDSSSLPGPHLHNPSDFILAFPLGKASISELQTKSPLNFPHPCSRGVYSLYYAINKEFGVFFPSP